MLNLDLSAQFRKERDVHFLIEATKIHKGFAKIYDGISPCGNVISDAFRAEIFRVDNCTASTITGRLGKSVPNSVINTALETAKELKFEHDYVQIIKVRSWNGRIEVVHGWIVTIDRDHNKHGVDYNHRLAKGKIIHTSTRWQSYELLTLIHNTFCY